MNTIKSPLISIITVSYNSVNSIEETILSVINQNFKDFEYIIIDGGSNDGTVDIIKKYQDKITFWVSEPDKGIYDAMNKGLKMVRGQLISLLNSDDWYEKETFNIIHENFYSNPNVDVFHGLLRFIDIDGNPDSIVGHYSSFLGKGMIEHPTCFIKNSVYEKTGEFSLEYNSASDFDWMMRTKKGGAVFFLIPNILTNFRRGGMSDSYKSSLEELEIKRKFGIVSDFKFFYWKWLIKILNVKNKFKINFPLCQK